MSEDFVWRDAGRTVVFRRDGVDRAASILAERGFAEFALLSTERALAGAAGIAGAAAATHVVAPGQVPEVAGALLGEVDSPRLVAFGGGRVVDAAKAIASVTGAAVAAIPTTLSGAEMTAIHRLPAGAEARVRGMVRPGLVIADPVAMTGLSEPRLRASAMNALAHGGDSLATPLANPVSRMAALRGAALIAAALDSPREERVAALAWGSLLCGYAIDSAGFAIHHVVCQTLVRLCGSPHAETNAAILPGAMAFTADRAPDLGLADALGTDQANLAARIRELGRPQPLSALGADQGKREEAIDAILQRPDLANTPGPSVTKADLLNLIETAW